MEDGKTDVLEKLGSKNWKERQEAYSLLRERWMGGERPSEAVLQMLQGETNIPAMEAAIDALLVVEDLRVGDVQKIFQNIGNPKTSIRTRIESLVDRLRDTDGVVEALCELLGLKSPKNIAGALSAMCSIVEKRDCRLEMVGSRIAGVMGHADKAVRAEGIRLCVELYRKNGDALMPYLESLKPIQMKELVEEFGKCRPAAKEVEPEATGIPDNFYRDAEDENWKVRVEAMAGLRRAAKSLECSSELAGALCRRVSDPNNQVFLTTLEVLCELRPRSPEIVKGLVERLKEKKGAVTDKIKETLSCMNVRIGGANAEFLRHKNPQVRVNLLDYSTRDLQRDELFIRMVGGCVLDPASEVRSKAVEVLHEIERKHGDVFSSILDANILSRLRTSRPRFERDEARKPEVAMVEEKTPDAVAVEKKAEEPLERVEARVETRREEGGVKRKHSQATVDVLLKSVNRHRIKGFGRREEVFTDEFIRMMDSSPFHQVLDLFDTVDKTAVSDFLIDFLVQCRASEASINSTLLSFISSRYILRESECRRLVEYLLENEMGEELEMMDRVYPVTKLFLVYQKIGSGAANSEILRLVKKYKMFRGDKRMFIDEMRRSREGDLEGIIKGCPDFLSFIDEIEGSFMSVGEAPEAVGENADNLDDLKTTCVGNESFNVEEAEIEASFDVLSIHSGIATPNLKKFRREFETPPSKADGLEQILDHLIDSNPTVSEVAFRRLLGIVETNIDELLFSSNSIISSISIQLFDVLHNSSFSQLILGVFLKISQSRVFCEQLRKETLLGANSDLIKIMKRQGTLRGQSSQDVSSLVGDILINLCLNSRPSVILEVYLEMLESSKDEILLKLIWRHSKALRMEDKGELSRILEVLTCFYDKNYASVLAEDSVTLKILQLHLKEMVRFYRENVYDLGVRGLAKVFVGSLMEGEMRAGDG